MSVKDFTLKLTDLEFVHSGLARPESIIAEKDGTLWCSDNRGSVSRIDSDGTMQTIGTIGGIDLKTVYLGSLAMPHLVKFQSPVAGLPMRHWD